MYVPFQKTLKNILPIAERNFKKMFLKIAEFDVYIPSNEWWYFQKWMKFGKNFLIKHEHSFQ